MRNIFSISSIFGTRIARTLPKPAQKMKNASIDPASLRILTELQKNARISSNELAEKIGMSASPCWRRQKELEDNGYIVRYAALLDRRKLGLAVVCLLHVSLLRHAEGVV